MKQTKKINKGIGDSITNVFENGLDVNINITTDNLVRLGVFITIISVIIAAITWASKRIK